MGLVISKERWNEVAGGFLFLLSAFLFLSLFSYHPDDIPLYNSSPNNPPLNYGGRVGAYLAGYILFLPFGLAAWLVPVFTAIWGWMKLRGEASEKFYLKLAGIVLMLISVSSLLAITGINTSRHRFFPGGVVGTKCAEILQPNFGPAGIYVFIATLLLIALVLATEFHFISFSYKVLQCIRTIFRLSKRVVVGLLRCVIFLFKGLFTWVRKKKKQREQVKIVWEQSNGGKRRSSVLLAHKRVTKKEHGERKKKKQVQVKQLDSSSQYDGRKKKEGSFKLPSLTLLDSAPDTRGEIKEELANNSRILEETLHHFGVEARVVQVNQGPVISSYELKLAPGTKVHKITSLIDDISLAVKSPNVRIVAPVPGKSVVGVEVPNKTAQLVYLRDVISSTKFAGSDSKLLLALGKDMHGAPLVTDLRKMPHLLIAGTTGSGKTVCMNALILSVLFNATPNEVKFLMIDPKMVELSSFGGLPHLLYPVVTNAKKASVALKWIVEEMEKRYQLLARAGSRNIDGFNRLNSQKREEWAKEYRVVKEEGGLPYIVVIIDELADLMMVARSSVEDAITRLAQLSRAVGIHLILATQRPSVDVITGVIKANLPFRLSFQVSSKVDSRTVLDMNGAERLLGRGDMLFLPAGRGKPIRAQGSLVSDEEIERVINFLKEQQDPTYREELFLTGEEEGKEQETEGKDELFDEAVQIVTRIGQASISMLQRRLGIGYARAARLIDRMEERGIVGASRGSKPREILRGHTK